MKQFILPVPPDHFGQVRITGKDHHYLVNVRRMKKGSEIPALLPSGDPVRVIANTITRQEIVFSVKPHIQSEDRTEIPRIVLMQAIPKGSKMDMITRQAVECGVAEIVPFVSRHCVRRLSCTGSAQIERWRRIARNARQQSGSSVPTEIRNPVEMDGLFTLWEEFKAAGATGFALHTEPLVYCALHGYLKDVTAFVVLVIGPEGGFSPVEAEEFISHGFKPLFFRGSVMRVETTALYAIAAVRVLLLEKDSWVHIAKE
ncbi:MAG: RsmE family RNA methyltransferase [Spirochaetaceae bacterium]|jgi:16S rRNA (uracil1498-N3)-methyltransferase|nr:RsmE family RNA methyltransferase [Spirochaetaceae bacterium]